MLPTFAYVRPTTLVEAIQHLTQEGVRLHAGGTDLLGCLHDRVFNARTVVSLILIDDLRGIRVETDGSVHIGAMTTIAEIAAHPIIRSRYSALAEAAAVVASPQLRSQGTIAGNLCQKPRCWYYRGDFDCLRKGGDTCYAVSGENQHHCVLGGESCYMVHPSDTAPALIALAATVRITGPGGSRSMTVEKFHVPPSVDPQRETFLEQGEIITEVVLQPAPDGLRSSYRKVRGRASWDFALAGLALVLRFDGDTVIAGRVVLSGAAPVPWRTRETAKVLVGTTLDSATIARATEVVMAGAEPLEHNSYKVSLFKGLLTDQLEAIAKG